LVKIWKNSLKQYICQCNHIYPSPYIAAIYTFISAGARQFHPKTNQWCKLLTHN